MLTRLDQKLKKGNLTYCLIIIKLRIILTNNIWPMLLGEAHNNGVGSLSRMSPWVLY